MSAVLDTLTRRQERLDAITRSGNWAHPALTGARHFSRRLDGSKFALANRQAAVTGTVDEKAMTAPFCVSAISPDRSGDEVIPEGCRDYLKGFEANHPISWNHLTHQIELPIATAGPPGGPLSWDILSDRIHSTAHFHDRTELAEQVFELVVLKVIKGASIGFVPILGERIREEEPAGLSRDEVLFGWPGFRFLRWEPVEWAVCMIPCHRETVSMVLGRDRLAGRQISATIRKDLEPFRLPRRLWRVEREFREDEHPRGAGGQFGSGGGGSGAGGDAASATVEVKEEALPEAARSKLGKLREALAAVGEAVFHPGVTAKKAVAGAKAKLIAMHEKYGTTGTALILGAAIVATPIPIPGATPAAVWAVSKLLTVFGFAKAGEAAKFLVLKAAEGEPEELSEEDAARLGQEFVAEFLAGCGLSPELEPLEGSEEEAKVGWFLRKSMTGETVETGFDVSKEKLRPASVVYDFVARHLDCPVKEVYESSAAIPSAKMGGFLSAWEEETAALRKVDTRNIQYDGDEAPPRYEVVQLSSEKSRDFLVDGLVFFEGTFRLVVELSKSWYGLQLTLYTRLEDRARGLDLISRTWEAARSRHNYLKGEAFSLSGEFLSRTAETWKDVFLPEKVSGQLARTIKQLNDKGKDFANRGTIMMGPPGTGKTLSGRVIRNEAKSTFVWISAKDFHHSGAFGGFSYAFELARELAPTVLFFEDVDHWLDSWTVDMVKTEMDGIGRHSGVWTILTTNFPEHLPEALIDRPGRFHDVLLFGLPDETARRAMLTRWLPELSGDAVGLAIKGTEGYSGAHVYELCHFARVLHDDEGKDYPAAVQAALEKVREQRRLIGTVIGGPRRRSLPALVARYKDGRSLSKRTKVARVIPKRGSLIMKSVAKQGPPPSAPARDAGDQPPAEGTGAEAVQAVLCPKAAYPSAEDAAAYVTGQGLDASDVEDAGEHWAFIQFEPGECGPQTARREALEDGCEVVYCSRGQTEGTGQGERVATPEGEGKTVKTKTCSACGPKALGEQPGLTPNGKPGKDEAAEKKLKAGIRYLKAVKAVMDEHGELQDHPAIQKWHGKTYEGLAKLCKDAYADHDFGFPAQKQDHEEPDEDDAGGKPDGDEDDKDKPSKEEEKALAEALARLSERVESGSKALFQLTGKRV